MKFKKKIQKNKKVLIAVAIVALLVVGFVVFSKTEEKVINSNEGSIERIPLSQNQINLVGNAVLSSEFIKDLPSKGIIGLQFYDFKNGQRIWQSGFLIGKNGFMNSGNPDLILIMHSKYISELNNKDLCEIIHEAENNNDMWVESQESNAKLLLKYSSMLKYRDCFGF